MDCSLEFENDSYIKIITTRDHKFSFGGLSGGVLLNEEREAVGIITAQDIFRFKYDKNGKLVDDPPDPQASGTQVFDTIYITPVVDVADLHGHTLGKQK